LHQSGVVHRVTKTVSHKSVAIENYFDKQIRLVTRHLKIRMRCNHDTLSGKHGIAEVDGDLEGWCVMIIDCLVYNLPSIWLESLSVQPPETVPWHQHAHIDILAENLIQYHSSESNIAFGGDLSFLGIKKIDKIVKKIDQL